MVWGTADGLGDDVTWRRFLGATPNGALEVVPGAGHMVWFDEIRLVADRIRTLPRRLTRPQAGRSRSAGPM